MQAIEDVNKMVIAFSHVLDLGFNKGKGKILEKWTKEMSEGIVSKRKVVMTEKSLNFLQSMPTVVAGKRPKRNTKK